MLAKLISNNISKFLYTHAYWVCMFVGMGGLLSYIVGFKKGGKIATFSIVIYWVVAAVCSIK